MFFNYIIQKVAFIIIFIYILFIININKDDINNNLWKFSTYSNFLRIKNITDINDIYFNINKINYSFSKKFGLIEVKYFINFRDNNYNNIKPSNILSFYKMNILCNIYISETNKNIYSIANIYENRYFFCVEYIKIEDKANFGIMIYKINNTNEEIEYYQQFFFSDEIFNINQNPTLENNNLFNMTYIYKSFNELLNKIKKHKADASYKNEAYNLKSSFLKPPLFSLKRDIAQIEGNWNFNNIYNNYFCFCNGDSCIKLKILSFNEPIFQYCKYYFYLTIIDNHRDLYQKTHYLLSDFFDENIESSDALPIFKEMILKDFNVHYLTMSYDIYNQLCLSNKKCLFESQIIFGIKKINGDILEGLLELILRLKAVIAAEKYYCIDNLFYNIDYITYIFLGHGVTYIKSYLYRDYLSPTMYNKILLPPCKKFIKLALDAGWKRENIIKIGYPRWDSYDSFSNSPINDERAIFLMFTWRKMKKGRRISNEYFNSLTKLLNNRELNINLNKNNVKLFFCFHHSLKDKIVINTNKHNIRIISQNKISSVLKNSSLIITDFSSILFDAIVQRKPLILFIPDCLDPNLENIYTSEYYETINKIKNGIIYLGEVFVDLKKVINKIIYYINNGFILEPERLRFYNEFRLKKSGNTKRFVNYLKHLL